MQACQLLVLRLSSDFSLKGVDDNTAENMLSDYTIDVEVEENRIGLTLWDTAGSGYNRLLPLSYPIADIILICFSIPDFYSLENVAEKWVPEVLHYCSSPPPPFLLIGCKSDLRHDSHTIEMLRRYNQNLVTAEEAERVVREVGARMYLECSAKTGEGVMEVLEQAARESLCAPKLSNIPKRRLRCLIL